MPALYSNLRCLRLVDRRFGLRWGGFRVYGARAFNSRWNVQLAWSSGVV